MKKVVLDTNVTISAPVLGRTSPRNLRAHTKRQVCNARCVHVEQLKKLQKVRTIARKMGIDTRNVTMKELIRAIQRAEGNKDCYMSVEVLKCEQTNCLWREDCD